MKGQVQAKGKRRGKGGGAGKGRERSAQQGKQGDAWMSGVDSKMPLSLRLSSLVQ